MKLGQRSIVLLLALMSPLARSALAQTYHRPDSAKIARAAEAGARLVHWVETTNRESEQAIFLRNTSGEPIQITSYELYDCVNIWRRVCGRHSPGPSIAPGETVQLAVVERGLSDQSWSFKYRFEAAFVSDSVKPDTTRH